MMLEKEMFSIDDGRYRVTARLSMLPADCSMRVAQPQRRHGLRWSPDGSAEQAVLLCRRNAGSDGHRFRLSDPDCQRGTTAPNRADNGTRAYITGIEFAPELSASGVHGAVALCGRVSSLSRRTASVRVDFPTHR